MLYKNVTEIGNRNTTLYAIYKLFTNVILEASGQKHHLSLFQVKCKMGVIRSGSHSV